MGNSRRAMNVLFVAVDDLRPELGCYGNGQVVSPHIDRLAGEGMVFERAYCQQAVCGPSRASLLSGCRPDTIGAYGYDVRLRDHMPDVVTLPQYIRSHGYETVSIGKVYHHRDDDPQGWSVSPYMARGDWRGRGYLTDEVVEAMRANRGATRRRGIGPAVEAADVPDEAYPDGKNTRRAIEELRRLREKRFFLAMGFLKPHLPFNAPRRYWDLYDREAIELADNPFPPEGVTEYSLTNFGELRQYLGIPAEGDVPEGKARELIHGYLACVSYMDALVGQLLGELDRLGLRDSTIVVLWGDHGWKLGEHACWCKHTNFEIDTRAPLVVSVPGMTTRGARTGALTEFVDLYPTLCELCGLTIPDHVAGRSFVPVLENPDREWKKAALSQYPRGEVMGYSLRTEHFRYVEWRERATGTVRARELYDHREDPGENANVADRMGYGETVEEMARLLREKL